MDTYQKYIADSLEMGFSYAVLLRDLTLTCSPDLRAYCNADSCANYGKTWVCLPGCGTLESCQNQISKYRTGIVLQRCLFRGSKMKVMNQRSLAAPFCIRKH